MNLLEALADPALFGASQPFAALESWKPWLTFLAAVYGLPLDTDDEAIFRECTGRSIYQPPPGGWSEVACIVGRQSGKTRIASAIVAFEAALAPASRDGEYYALLLAQDQRASIRAGFSYVRSVFDASAILRREVIRTTADTLDLANGMRVATYPCRPSSIRGLRARVILLDELAYFVSSEGFARDREMLIAARPALATTAGKLIAISSPYGQSGALWDLHRKHFGRDDSSTLIWQASAPRMNPTLSADYLARMEQDDPDAYRSEVLGEFRAGLSMLLDPEAIQACVVPGRRELPPVEGIHYSAFVDPSGGRKDSFTLAIAHAGGERCVVDVVRAWRAPFNPSGVVAEIAALLREYRVSKVVGDRYAGEWPREQFRAQGVSYDVAAKPKSDLYLALVSSVHSERIELPENEQMLRELRSLERRRGSSGRDRVDHPPGGHDDLANAVAGVAELVIGRARGVTWEDVLALGQMDERFE